MANPIVTSGFLRIAAAALALLAIVGFALLAGFAIAEVWQAKVTPTPSDGLTYFESALAGLIGGIVATAFGVSVPERKLAALSNISSAGFNSKQAIGAIYVTVYLLVGVVAAVTWISHGETASGMVKNLAVIFAGLLIPIVGAFFANSSQANLALTRASGTETDN